MMPRIRRPRARLISLIGATVLVGGVACSAISTDLPVPGAKPAASNSSATVDGLKSAPVAPAIGGPAVSTSAQSANPQPAAAGAPANAAARDTAAAAAPAQGSANPPLTTLEQSSTTAAQNVDRKVIRNGQLTVEVTDMEQALAQTRAIAARSGGFVSASSTHVERVDNQDRTVADLTLQVRSLAADSAISDLRAMGKVLSENSSSQDVTEEYVDISANLDNLRASESAILKLMDRATQIQDVLALQRELSNVRGQIDRLQGRQRFIDNRTEMTTITIALRLPPPESANRPPTAGAWDPGAVAQRGWQASLTLLRGTADVVITVLAFSWWLLPFAAAGGYWLVQRRRAAARTQPTASAGPA